MRALLTRCGRIARRWALPAAVCLALAGALSLAATDVPDDQTGPPSVVDVPAPELTPESLEARIARVKASKDLDEATRAQLLELYEDALTQLQLMRDAAALAAQFKKERDEVPARLEAMRAELAKAPVETAPALLPDATVAQLEQMLAQEEAALEAAKGRVAELDAESKRRSDRRAEIAELVAAAKQRLAEIAAAVDAKPGAEEDPESVVAKRLLLLARKAAIEAEVEAYAQELLSYDARRELLPLRRDLAAREVSQGEKLVKAWRQAVDERRRSEAERDAQRAQEARRIAAQAHPAVHALAQRNAELAERRTGPEGLAAKVAAASKRLEAVEGELNRLTAQFSKLEERVKAGRRTRAAGRFLIRKRADVPDVRKHRRSLKARQVTISEAQLELIELEDEREQLGDAEWLYEETLSAVGPSVDEATRQDFEEQARELLRTRREYLDALIGDYRTYLDKLDDLDSKDEQLIAKSEEYARYIEERILWLQSTSALRPVTFAEAWEALLWLASPAGWGQALRAMWKDLTGAPVLFVTGVLLLAALVFYRGRLRRELLRTSEMLLPSGGDRFYPTLKALWLTLLTAAPWPLILVFAGWRLSARVEAPEFVAALGAGLRRTAAIYFVLEALRGACRPGGLADKHFRMQKEAAHELRKYVGYYTVIVLPLILIGVTVESQSNVAWADSLGRLALIAATAALATFVGVALRPGGRVLGSVLARHREGWLYRFRYVLFAVAVGIPAAGAFLAALGYYYTAQQLRERMLVTVLLLLGALLAHAMTARWLLVVRRRLIAGRAPERGVEREGPPGRPALPADVEEAQDLFALSLQTRRFLRAILGFVVLIAFWLIWADVLPALGILRRVQLWSVGTGEGATIVTVADLALALLVAVVTIVAGRNVPGLLEFAVLQRLPMDRGVRFAIASLSRYVIMGIGVVVAFGAIGIGWSKVQWLLAAMTVGLGFGLQEIFGNFVSGLIILFERPMRVGDTVTVGDTTGTVTKIRIRATTILDWDRKELVVPNKEFVTGRLVNWTLSDTILRMLFPVGIAYGSDTKLAEQELLRVAQENPLVLKDPPPTVIFRGFGDSALQFELRVFIPNMESYLKVWHELNMAIDEAFREAKIEIAFPQRDIHVRSVKAPFPVVEGEADEGDS